MVAMYVFKVFRDDGSAIDLLGMDAAYAGLMVLSVVIHLEPFVVIGFWWTIVVIIDLMLIKGLVEDLVCRKASINEL